MPKAKPVSLFPLSFEQAIDVLIKASPKPKKKRAMQSKSKRKLFSQVIKKLSKRH